MKDKKAIIFDMDGVLVKTSCLHEKAFKKILDPFHLPLDFSYKSYSGMKTLDVMLSYFKNNKVPIIPEKCQQLAQEKTLLASKAIETENIMEQGTLPLLHFLKKKYILALASSASQRNVDIIFSKYKLQSLFEVCLTSLDVKKAKPAPDIYLKALSLLNLPREECLVLEDSLTGIKSSLAAGIETWGIAGTLSPSHLSKTGVTKVLESLQELKNL